MKTTKKQSQCQRLLAYLKKHRKGITSLESAVNLGIVCLHKRISELEDPYSYYNYMSYTPSLRITRTKERTASGSIVTRYKLAR
jgi:hypothetical protein